MSEIRRILILTADAGFGHRSAANAIRAVLQETYENQVVAEIVNRLNDRRVPAVLRKGQSGYDRIVMKMPNLYRFGYKTGDAAVPSSVAKQVLAVALYEAMQDVIKHYQPDAIVSTYPFYPAPLGAIYAITKHDVPLLTVITDLISVNRLWFHEATDLCLVPTTEVRDLAIQNGTSPEKIRITGIPVHPALARRDREKTAIRADLGWQPNLTTALAVGSRRVKHMPEILEAFNHSGHSLLIVAVAGGDDRLYHQLQNIEWHVPALVCNFVENMPDFMHAADCIVCKAGGLIVTESLACGLPLLLIDVIPGQETGNAEYVIRHGAGEMGQKPMEALEILFHWLERDGELLTRRAQNAKNLGRPRAAYEAAELAWEAAAHGPRSRRTMGIGRKQKLIELLRQHGVRV